MLQALRALVRLAAGALAAQSQASAARHRPAAGGGPARGIRRDVPERHRHGDARHRAVRPAKEGLPELGRAQDPRAPAQPRPRHPVSGDQHGPRGPRPARARERRRRRRYRAEGRRSRARPRRMTCGVPTTRASSCSPIGATANRSPSPTLPRAPDRLRCALDDAGNLRLHGLRASVSSLRLADGDAHRQRRAVCFVPTRSTGSADCRSEWLRLGSRSSGFGPGIPSRTAATNACT
jgi:hypothetical protein